MFEGFSRTLECGIAKVKLSMKSFLMSYKMGHLVTSGQVISRTFCPGNCQRSSINVPRAKKLHCGVMRVIPSEKSVYRYKYLICSSGKYDPSEQYLYAPSYRCSVDYVIVKIC